MDADLPEGPMVQSHVPAAEVADMWHEQRITDAEALRVVNAAIPVLRGLHGHPSLYRAYVLRYDGAFHVAFIDKDVPTDSRAMGDPGKVMGLEVRIDPIHFVPVGHNFMK